MPRSSFQTQAQTQAHLFKVNYYGGRVAVLPLRIKMQTVLTKNQLGNRFIRNLQQSGWLGYCTEIWDFLTLGFKLRLNFLTEECVVTNMMWGIYLQVFTSFHFAQASCLRVMFLTVGWTRCLLLWCVWECILGNTDRSNSRDTTGEGCKLFCNSCFNKLSVTVTVTVRTGSQFTQQTE